MSLLERARFRALALKVESSAGVDAIAGTPASGDWVDAEFQWSPDNDLTPNPSFTGSMDPRPAIVGGGRFMLPGIRVPLRGSGTAGTAPEVFRILRAAGMVGVDTAAAVGAPTAATAGSATTATLASPFGTTAQEYRGMPITLAGNPATVRTVLVTDYTTGRVATLSRSFSPVLDTDTTAQVPVNNMLKLSDVETDWPTLTAYAYQAGQLVIGAGCVTVNPRLRLTAGGIGFLEYDLVGSLLTPQAEQALPAGAATVSRTQPPVWRGGECQIGLSASDRASARAAEVVISLGSAAIVTPDPEADAGYGQAALMSRSPSCEATIMANSTAAPLRNAALIGGASACMFSAILGSTAGNRLGILFSPATLQRITNAQRDGADTETLLLAQTTPGTGVFIAAF